MRAERRQRVADGGQTSLPWPPSRSVIDSVGTAGDELARPIRHRLRPTCGRRYVRPRTAGPFRVTPWAEGSCRVTLPHRELEYGR